MTRKRGAPVFEAIYYHPNRKTCENGHEGRIGKSTRLCCGCYEEHLDKGKAK